MEREPAGPIDDFMRLSRALDAVEAPAHPEPDADRRAWSALRRKTREEPLFGAAARSSVLST
jgi:hypothetical protein